MKYRERPKRQMNPDWWIASLVMQGTDTRGLTWTASKQWTALTSQLLEVYIEALTGFSHIPSPDSLNTFLSQG